MSAHSSSGKGGKRRTVPVIRRRKVGQGKKPLTMLTAYGYSQAQVVDEAGVDLILVGDSAANVVLGYDTTLPITVEEMLLFTRAVRRGTSQALVVGDMPFASYQVNHEEAVRNAMRFLKEAGADAIKLEGGEEVRDTVAAIVRAGVPVMGHLGLTPQTVSKLGGYKVQGRSALAARTIVDGAVALEEAGVFALVLECVPQDVAREVTERLDVPTIGIGAGPHCDGQVLVYHDLLGLGRGGFSPRFVKRYADLGDQAVAAIRTFVEDVQAGAFPAEEHSFTMSDGEDEKLLDALSRPWRGAVADGLIAPAGEDPD
jgi:3-methyl-2-oxobutanoate hydroxymethyltransferase